MIHKLIVPHQRECTVLLQLPDDFIGEEIEIIAFKKNEKKSLPKKVSFNAMSINTKKFKFDRDEANQR